MDALNSLIGQRLAEDGGSARGRHRLIWYALDPELLPDQIFYTGLRDELTALEDDGARQAWCMSHMHLFALYLVRLFFEESDGREYNTLLQERLGFKIKPEWLAAALHQGLFEEAAGDVHVHYNLYRILAECWIIANGYSSSVWHTLIPLVGKVRALGSEANVDQIEELLEDVADSLKHPALAYLADRLDRDLVDSLLVMSSRLESPCLSRCLEVFTDHDKYASAQVGWRFQQNRRQVCLRVQDLTLRDFVDEIMFVQGPQRFTFSLNGCSSSPVDGKEGWKSIHLLEFSGFDFPEGFDFLKPLTLKLGGTDAEKLTIPGICPSTGGPALFYCRAGKWVQPMIEEDRNQVYAHQLYAFWPSSKTQGSFTYDAKDCNHSAVIASCGRVSLSGCLLDIPVAHDAPAGTLLAEVDGEVRRIKIGPRATLQLENGLDIHIEGHDDWLVTCEHPDVTVWGDESEPVFQEITLDGLKLHKVIADQVQGRLMILKIDQGLVGGQNLLEEAGAESQGWTWCPDDQFWGNAEWVSGQLLQRHLRLGGSISTPEGLTVSVDVPYREPKWWWRGIGVHSADIATGVKEFDALNLLRNAKLCILLSQEDRLVARNLDTQVTIHEVTTPIGLSEYSLRDLLPDEKLCELWGSVAEILLAGEPVCRVVLDPGEPRLLHAGEEVKIYIPGEFIDWDQWCLVAIREDQLGELELPTQNLPSNAGWSTIPVPLPAEGIGCWSVLTRRTERNQADTILLLALASSHTLISQAVCVQPPQEVELRQRIPEEMHGQALNALNYLSSVGLPPGVLRDAIEKRNTLGEETPILDEEARQTLSTEVTVDRLGESLDFTLCGLLDLGWNPFIATQGRLLQDIFSSFTMTDKRMRSVYDICPAIEPLVRLENWGLKDLTSSVRSGVINRNCKAWRSLFPALGPNQSGPEFRAKHAQTPLLESPFRIGPWNNNEVEVASEGQKKQGRPIDRIDGRWQIKCAIADWCTLRFLAGHDGSDIVSSLSDWRQPEPINNTPPFAKNWLRIGVSESHDEATPIFLTDDRQTILQECFEKACDPDDYGPFLAGLFRDVAARCREIEEEHPRFCNRRSVWEVATLSRLFTRDESVMGHDCKRIISAVVRQSFRHCRNLLMYDLVAVEWLLSWYHGENAHTE